MMHDLANIGIGLCYLVIPFMIWRYGRTLERAHPVPRVMHLVIFLGMTFVASCGVGHVLAGLPVSHELVTAWHVFATFPVTFGSLVTLIAGLAYWEDWANAIAKDPENSELSDLLPRLDIGRFYWDLEADELHWDEVSRAVFGIPGDWDENIDYLQWASMVLGEESLKNAQEVATRAIAERRDYIDVIPMLTPAGVKHVLAVGRPVFNGEGKAVGLEGLNINMTDRLRAVAMISRTLSSEVLRSSEKSEALLRSLRAKTEDLFNGSPAS